MENVEVNLLNLERKDLKYKHYTKEKRQGILEKLLQQMKDNNLKHGAINEVSFAFQVSRLTVSRIWHVAQTQYRKGKI
ncbi:hypothetical protein CWI39_0741p0030, partial [Hamiltosporidium magnivora]